MKRKYLGIAPVIIAMIMVVAMVLPGTSAPVEPEEVQLSMPLQEMELVKAEPVADIQIQPVAESKAATIDDVVGTYMTRDISVYTPEREANALIEIKKNNDGKLTISNLYRLKEDVVGEWDATTSTIRIKPQEIFKHDTYGPVTINTWSVSADGKRVVYNTTADIIISVNEDGGLTFSPWGLFVASGDYMGSSFEAYAVSKAYHPNGTMTLMPFGTEAVEENYQVLLMEDTPGRVMVCNMLNNGLGIVMNVNPDGSGEITPQWVYNQALYGDFYIYSVQITGTGSSAKMTLKKDVKLTATQTEDGIKFSPWGCVCLKSTTIFAKTAVTSSIKTDFKLSSQTMGDNPMAGKGTQAEPYKVETLDHLQWIAKSISSSKTFQGVYFELANDIDCKGFSGRYFPVGGLNDVPFNGIFDGKGHSIRNLTQNFYGEKYAGVFGYLGATGLIKNLNVENFNFINSGKNIGGVVGSAAGEVQNCNATGSIESTGTEIGGVVGSATALISGCSFNGSILGGVDMGGIVGYTTSSVENCHANAAINLTVYIPNGTGTHASGGIAGAVYAKAATAAHITDCYFSGSISDQQRVNQLGGICGAMYYGSISRCFNVGRLTCYYGAGADGNSPLAGGICGYLADVLIDNCYNAGAVNAPNSDFSGGIAGYAGGNSSSVSGVSNCYNSGMVNTNSKAATCAIIGNVWAKIKTFKYENNYYDKQTAGLEYPCDGGLSTAELISGNALEGLPATSWVYEKGFYPRLKGISDNKAAYLSASAMMLSGEETVKKVRKPFTVSTANNIRWGFMTSDGDVVPSCDAITVDGGNVTFAKGKYALESIIAIDPDGTLKHYVLHVDPVAFAGSGTKEDPFQIKTADDLYTLQEATNTYLQTHKGDYFLMTNDIDVSSNPKFKGIAADGNSAHYFGGTFDGGNHYIHNFKLNSAKLGADGKLDASSIDYAGFIGITLPEAVVKNLRIADDCSFTFYRYSAPVVGYSLGKVENCHNYAPVVAYGQACAGIVGFIGAEDSSVENCLNAGDISLANGTSGGIVGYSVGVVKGAQNLGNVELTSLSGVSATNTTKNVGGIVGQNFGSVESSVNAGNIQGLTNVGGIIGQNSIISTTLKGGDVEGCVSYGVITGEANATSVGGIVGDLASYNTIKDNYYDAQLHPFGGANCTDPQGIKGLNTTNLMAVKLDNISSEKGCYPVVAALAGVDAVKAVSSTVVGFDALSHRNAVENEILLTLPEGTVASLAEGKAMKVEGNKVVLSLGSEEEANDVLKLTAKAYNRNIPLRAVAKLFEGKGTADDPHVIATVADWNKLAKATNEGRRDFRGHNFRLTTDLKFKEDDFTMAGASTTPFNGTFDGANHTISGFVVGSTTDKTSLNIGLMGHVGPAGKIANLKIKDAAVTAYQNAGAFAGELCGVLLNCVNEAEVTTGSGYAGGLAGTMKAGSYAEKCTNMATVTTLASNYVGGIAAVCYGEMQSCTNEGTVIAYAAYGGGLAGTMGGPATDCSNKGEVMATKPATSTYLGGLFGQLETGAYLTDCANSGKISGSKNYTGGIFGTGKGTAANLKENGVTVKGCVNTADITTTGTYLGGIAGSIPASYTLVDCENTGNLSSNAAYIGGIVATAGNGNFPVVIENCVNKGKISNSTAGKNYFAGIVGYDYVNSTVSNCVNLGDIETNGYMVGGIAGSLGGVLKACVNHGNITGNDYAMGGIAGYGGTDAYVDDCVNAGDVTALGTTTKTYGTIGGIAGYGYLKINACANFGSLKGEQNIGGIAGTGFSGIKVTNSYNAGKITYSKQNASNIGNIYAAATAMPGNYYDKEVNDALPADAKVEAKGLAKVELMDAEIPGFVKESASYPTPAGVEDIPEARLATVNYRLGEGSTADNVVGDFLVGSHKSISWRSSDESLAAIDGNKVVVKNAEGKKLTLTADCGTLKRTFEFTINCKNSGVEEITESEAVETLYFTPDGKPATAETQGVIIVVTRNANGTTSTTKRVVK